MGRGESEPEMTSRDATGSPPRSGASPHEEEMPAGNPTERSRRGGDSNHEEGGASHHGEGSASQEKKPEPPPVKPSEGAADILKKYTQRRPV